MGVADRHLLFGLLALQNGMISQAQLVHAFQAWTLDKSKSLADHLEARGDLTGAKRAILEALAEVHREACSGDVEKSFAAVPAGKSTRERLAELGDPDLKATLGRVASAQVATFHDDVDCTISYAVGAATSDGQRFRVLRPHARGGLGAVFVALDSELHREVALKQILDSHADDAVSRQRFLLEAEITGGLEHPGIVPVYGLGTYGDGRPYYAMRFIRGDSLKHAISRFQADGTAKSDPGRRSLELRELLRRFVDVCNAVEYAHTRGVLHRDIKPANIIVGNYGETLVIDWGLAKAQGRTDTSDGSDERPLTTSPASGSADTLPGSALGTPSYMSPEQAAGRLDILGPRSDVYSLGATLYCLLTGEAPFEGDDVGAILRAVQGGDFRPPRSLAPSLDRALEAVCLQAMALAPEDRYASPRALADDLERWAADEPVSAWREPPVLRARRWMRRNRTAVTAGSAAVLMALVGLASVLAVQTQANRSLRDANGLLTVANQRESLANSDLRAANSEVRRQSDLARRNFVKARQAVDDSFTRVSESTLLKSPLPGLQPLRKELLEAALAYYQGFLREADNDPTLRSELAAAYFRVGSINADLGSFDEAVKALASARSMYLELLKSAPADRDLRFALAGCDLRAGYLYFETTNHYAECLSVLERAIAVQEPLTREVPGNSGFLTALANSHNRLGAALASHGQFNKADVHFGVAAQLRERLVTFEPRNARFMADLGLIRQNLALLRDYSGRTDGIANLYVSARADLERVVLDHPEDPAFRADLGLICRNLGMTLGFLGRTDEAIEALEKSVTVLRQVVRENPAVESYRNRYVYSGYVYAKWLIAAGRPDDALEVLRPARETADAVLVKEPGQTLMLGERGAILSQTAFALARKGEYGPARETLERAIATHEDVLTKTEDVKVYYDAACSYDLKAVLLSREPGAPGSAAERRRATDRAMTSLRSFVASGYRTPHWFRHEPELVAVRDRPDFQLLIMDLEFPPEPFRRPD
jgi:serine/threonine protein kinase/tetratricopeptide (TPR) repeat protein